MCIQMYIYTICVQNVNLKLLAFAPVSTCYQGKVTKVTPPVCVTQKKKVLQLLNSKQRKSNKDNFCCVFRVYKG